MCVRKRACLWRVRRGDKGDIVHSVGLKYLEIQLSVASLLQRTRQCSFRHGFFALHTGGKQVPVLLSSLSLNLFCCFLTCFSHPHPLGISNTQAHIHMRSQMRQHTHTLEPKCGTVRHACCLQTFWSEH